ncbi:hypothetical protein KEGY108214_14025 [Kerstersia gyiorum]
MRAASMPLPTRSMPSAMRVTTVIAADWCIAGGHHHVQPIAAIPAATAARARTARSVSRLAGRHGAARCPGLDGLSVLLAGKVTAHSADRLSQREHHHPRGRHAGARHRHDLGCRHPDLACQPDRRSQGCGFAYIPADACHTLRDPALHRARHRLTRLPAPESRAGSPAIDHGVHLHSRDDREAAAPLFLDQRVERTGRCPAARRWASS